jgi:hypothetical protein
VHLIEERKSRGNKNSYLPVKAPESDVVDGLEACVSVT